MDRRPGLVLIALAAIACGESSGALSGPGGPTLITPTPWPSSPASPFACGEAPPEKCAIARRQYDEQQGARASSSGLVFRSYSPMPAMPFIASTPRPTLPPATPTPEPPIRSCTASDLTGAYSGDNGAGGTNLRVVAIANTSDTPCGIRGTPSVRILLANRAAEATYAEASDGPLAVLPPNGARPVVGEPPKPGVLSLVVGISRSCSFSTGWMSSLLLILPGDGSAMRIDLPARNSGGPSPTPIPSASCLDAPYFPQIGVWGISIVAQPEPLASRSQMRAVVNAPGLAVAGETLRFEVVLKNENDTPVALEPCPSYSMSISWDQGYRSERHLLNCAASGPLAPHGSATFAMEIGVPADWPVTLNGGLTWFLEGYSAGVKLPLGIARRA